MLIETLQQYGLTEKESKVYLAGLGLGSAPGSTIARHAGENRVTVYSILKELVKKGIFTTHKKASIAYFSPISPEILARNIEDTYMAVQGIIPALMAIAEKSGNKTKIEFFEGIDGLQKLFDDFSTSDVDMRTIIGTPDAHNDILLKASAGYRAKRKAKGLIAKRIITATENTKKIKDDDKLYGRKTVIIKNHPFNINADINIYGPGKVSFLFFDKSQPHAIIVRNDDLYQTFNGIFTHIWLNNGGK